MYINTKMLNEMILKRKNDGKIREYLIKLVEQWEMEGDRIKLDNLADDIQENADLEENGFSLLQANDFLRRFEEFHREKQMDDWDDYTERGESRGFRYRDDGGTDGG